MAFEVFDDVAFYWFLMSVMVVVRAADPSPVTCRLRAHELRS